MEEEACLAIDLLIWKKQTPFSYPFRVLVIILFGYFEGLEEKKETVEICPDSVCFWKVFYIIQERFLWLRRFGLYCELGCDYLY